MQSMRPSAIHSVCKAAGTMDRVRPVASSSNACNGGSGLSLSARPSRASRAAGRLSCSATEQRMSDFGSSSNPEEVYAAIQAAMEAQRKQRQALDDRPTPMQRALRQRRRVMEAEVNLKVKTHETFPRLQPFAQTLQSSITIQGTGFSLGQESILRLSPARAGDGRYFVRVPRGTLTSNYSTQEPESPPAPWMDALSDGTPLHLDEGWRTVVYMDWLRLRRDEGYTGTIDEFTSKRGLEQRFWDPTPQAPWQPPARRLEEPTVRLATEECVPATLDNLVDDQSQCRLSLQRGTTRILSVEALLAALEASGVTDVRMELEGSFEIPALDGSAYGWALAIREAGTRPLLLEGSSTPVPRIHATLESPVTLGEGESFVSFVSGTAPVLTAGMEYEAAALGRPWASWSALSPSEFFSADVAPARRCLNSVREFSTLVRIGDASPSSDALVQIADGLEFVDVHGSAFPNEAARQHLWMMTAIFGLLGSGARHGLPQGHVIAYNASLDMLVSFARQFRDALVQEGASE